MDNPYLKYLNDEFDEVSLMKKSHAFLIEGKTDEAVENARLIEAVRYVKQSLYKVEKQSEV
jgi:predicted esterase